MTPPPSKIKWLHSAQLTWSLRGREGLSIIQRVAGKVDLKSSMFQVGFNLSEEDDLPKCL